MIDYSESVNQLFSSQLESWELARVNYGLLNKVKTRELSFDEFSIVVQFNPERIRSSAAKVDAKSIEARPCFLCAKNRPSEQRGISFTNGMTLLINPFPIFPRHLTIPSELHIDQRIKNNFEDILNLAKALPGFVIFYNGPQCGASAPDHLHFQAGNKGFLPIEKDFSGGKFTRLITEKEGIKLLHWTRYNRGIMTFSGSDRKKLTVAFNKFLKIFSDLQPDRPEPMLNMIIYSINTEWVIHLIPRKVHRPAQFFAEGDRQILLSPASVDLGGVIITPREEDFYKINVPDIKDIFHQVCFDENEVITLFHEVI